MKKLFQILGICAAGLAFSQQNYILEAGYLNSTIKTTPDLKIDPKSGFYAGAGYENRWGERVSAQVEFHYANLGGSYSEADNKVTLNMHQIYMPLSIRFYPTYELGIFAGGYVNLRLKNKVTVSGPAANLVENELNDYYKEEVKGTDYGVQFGADYRIYRGLFVKARYNIGMNNLIENPKNGEEMKMNFWQAGIGYNFR